MSIENLEKLSKQDLYSIACSLLYYLKEDKNYSMTSELVYLLNYKDFTQFIKYYGGTTITVPTFDEISQSLKILLVYQYYELEGLSWDDSLKEAGFSKEDSDFVRGKMNYIRKIIKTQKVSGRKYS